MRWLAIRHGSPTEWRVKQQYDLPCIHPMIPIRFPQFPADNQHFVPLSGAMRLTSLISGVFLVTVLALTGCGSDDGDSGSDDTSDSSSEDSGDSSDDSGDDGPLDVCALVTTADLQEVFEETKGFMADPEDLDLGDQSYLSGSQISVVEDHAVYDFSITGTSPEAIAGLKSFAERVIG